MYSDLAIRLSSGKSHRPFLTFNKIRFGPESKLGWNTPHVLITEKSALSFLLYAVSYVWIKYSQGGGSSDYHLRHHSRLSMAPSSFVGACCHWAFHFFMPMETLTFSNSSKDQ